MRLILLVLGSLTLASCSRERLERAVSRTPTLPSDWPAAGFGVSLPPLDSPGLNAYQRDAVYLAHLLAAYYPDHRGDRLDTATLARRTRDFVRELDTVATDFAWRVRLQGFLAQLRDGHTSAMPRLYTEGEPYFSLSLWPDPDGRGLRLVSADSSAVDSTWRGAEVLAIGDLPVDSVFARVRAWHQGENRYYKDAFLRRYEPLPRYWRSLGCLTGPADPLSLTLRKTDGATRRITLRPDTAWRAWPSGADTARFAFARRQRPAFATAYLPELRTAYLQMNTSLDWAAMRGELKNYVPWPLRLPAKAFMRREKRRAGAEDFGAVLAELFARVARDSLRRVVVDLRHNPGGDERLGLQLMWHLADAHGRTDLLGPRTYYRFDGLLRAGVPGDYRRYRRAFAKTQGREPAPDEWVELDGQVLRQGFWQGIDAAGSTLTLDASVPKFDGELVVLTGPQTFSAAAILAATLQDNGLATVVGEPTGNRPGGPTGASRVKLPHTGTVIALSYVSFDRPDPTRAHLDAVYPDVYAPSTYEDYLRGGDPALEAALGIE